LLDEQLPDDPLDLFGTWLGSALEASLLDATAMTLSTVSASGQPRARVVLLKSWDARGFVFFTRYSTRKGADLASNPRAALSFHWRELSRQILIEGTAARIARAESEAYFASRPRDSQLAARAVSGLSEIESQDWLLARYQQQLARFAPDAPVAMPDDWGGYRLAPTRIELWQGQPGRLHDRIAYERAPDGAWRRHRLAP
jgi:pyridoxamine 5'-phosphate oxidase